MFPDRLQAVRSEIVVGAFPTVCDIRVMGVDFSDTLPVIYHVYGRALLEKKFSFPSPPRVANRLKKKNDVTLVVQTSLEGKSQNVGSSTKSFAGSLSI